MVQRMIGVPPKPSLEELQSTVGPYGTRVSGDGEVYHETLIDEDTGVRFYRPVQTADTSGEFPTQWHRDAYIAGLRRSLISARRNAQELAAMDPARRAMLTANGGPDRPENIEAELRRLGEPVD